MNAFLPGLKLNSVNPISDRPRPKSPETRRPRGRRPI